MKSVQKIYSIPLFVLIEAGLLVFLPLAIILIKPQLVNFRHILMLISLLYIFLVMRINHITRHDVGIKLERRIKPLFLILGVTAVFMVLELVYFVFFPQNASRLLQNLTILYSVPPYVRIIAYCLFSVPLQEFIFRGFYISRLEIATKSRAFMIVFTALAFGLMHGPFNSVALVVGTFLIGLFYGWYFLRYRDLPALILSHSLVGIPLALAPMFVK